MRAAKARKLLCAAATAVVAAQIFSCSPNIDHTDTIYSSPTLTVSRDTIVLPGNHLVRALPDGKIEHSDGRSYTISATEGYPSLKSASPLIDAAFALGIDATASMLAADSISAEEWFAIWQRGVFVDAPRCRALLEQSVGADTMLTATAWPLRTIGGLWILAAREVYLAEGSRQWLEFATAVARKTLAADTAIVLDRSTGLIHGYGALGKCSLRQWPRWMNDVDKYECMTLLDNSIEAGACNALADMLAEIGDADSTRWRSTSQSIARAVNLHLWQPDLGRYSEFLYGGIYPLASRIADNTAQPLAMLMEIPTPEMAAIILKSTPRIDCGIPDFFPAQAGTPPVTPSDISPIVQSLWAQAAARHSAGTTIASSLATLLASTFTPGMPSAYAAAESSASALRVLAGLTLRNDGLAFHPSVPLALRRGLTFKDVPYRRARLTISIKGSGSSIARFAVDGIEQPVHLIDTALTGNHKIEISLANNSLSADPQETSRQTWTPAVPEIEWTTPTAGTVTDHAPGIMYYLYVNGALYETFKSADFSIPLSRAYERVSVVPVSATGIYGLGSEPHSYTPAGSVRTLQAELFADAGTELVRDRRLSARLVETSPWIHSSITFTADITTAGSYSLKLCYANGSSPAAADSGCAVRLLRVNGLPAGAFVLPSRGDGWWLSTALSNSLTVALTPGTNTLEIICPDGAGSATALIDYLRVTSLSAP